MAAFMRRSSTASFLFSHQYSELTKQPPFLVDRLTQGVPAAHAGAFSDGIVACRIKYLPDCMTKQKRQ